MAEIPFTVSARTARLIGQENFADHRHFVLAGAPWRLVYIKTSVQANFA